MKRADLGSFVVGGVLLGACLAVGGCASAPPSSGGGAPGSTSQPAAGSARPDGATDAPATTTAAEGAAGSTKTAGKTSGKASGKRAKGAGLSAEAKRCASLPVRDEVRTPSGDDESVQADCQTVAEQGAKGRAAVEAACDGGDGAQCAVAGALARGRKTVAMSFELLSPICRQGAGRCQGFERRAAGLPMGSGTGSNPKPWFEKGCKAGDANACAELAEVLSEGGPTGAMSLQRTRCLAGDAIGCAPAVYLLHSRGVQVDGELKSAAGRVLAKRCDAGGALACNSLAFMIERGLASGDAPARYAQSCRGGSRVGCANLIFYGENHRRKARKLPYGDAAGTLAPACKDGGSELQCLAHGIALLRGRGVKRSYRAGRKALTGLCKRGHRPACRVR